LLIVLVNYKPLAKPGFTFAESDGGWISPQRFGQILCECREHGIEADADSLVPARVGVDGVLQVGGKNKQGAVLHPHHDLVGILSREFHDRRPDDAGLISRVMKVYRVRTRMSANVINTAQEVIGVAVSLVHSTLGENSGPTAGYLESVITDSQESQNAFRRIIDTSNEIPEFLAFI
jgi:hypothetical protein